MSNQCGVPPNVARRDPPVARSETATTGDLGHGGADRYGRRVRRLTAGLGCWLVQPVYVLVELLVAAGASAAYSLRDDTISALGMLACSPGHAGSVVDVCSPGHGADERRVRRLRSAACSGRRAAAAEARRRGTWGAAAVWLWVVSGLSAAAVGLVPVDRQPGWHVVAALPVFVLQPLAVLATAEALRRSGAVPPGVAVSGLVIGGLTLAAAAAFGLRLGDPTWVGGLERLALWPAYVWLGRRGAGAAGRQQVGDRGEGVAVVAEPADDRGQPVDGDEPVVRARVVREHDGARAHLRRDVVDDAVRSTRHEVLARLGRPQDRRQPRLGGGQERRPRRGGRRAAGRGSERRRTSSS